MWKSRWDLVSLTATLHHTAPWKTLFRPSLTKINNKVEMDYTDNKCNYVTKLFQYNFM